MGISFPTIILRNKSFLFFCEPLEYKLKRLFGRLSMVEQKCHRGYTFHLRLWAIPSPLV